MASPTLVTVLSPARERLTRGPKRKRSEQSSGWSEAAMPPVDGTPAIPRERRSPRRCKQGRRLSMYLVILNSSGAPELMAALQSFDKEALMVVN